MINCGGDIVSDSHVQPVAKKFPTSLWPCYSHVPWAVSFRGKNFERYYNVTRVQGATVNHFSRHPHTIICTWA